MLLSQSYTGPQENQVTTSLPSFRLPVTHLWEGNALLASVAPCQQSFLRLVGCVPFKPSAVTVFYSLCLISTQNWLGHRGT